MSGCPGLADLPLPHPDTKLGGNQGSGYTHQTAAFVPWESLDLPFWVRHCFPVGLLSTIEQIRFLDVGFVLSPPILTVDKAALCVRVVCLRTLEIGGPYLN